MALFYHIGKIFLCVALTLQGLYVLGLIPGQEKDALTRSMNKGIQNFQTFTNFHHPILDQVKTNLALISQAIGGLLALAALNVLFSSRFVIKLNILGLLLLTFFIGVPYSVFQGKSPLDPTDKTLFHFYANLALIGGLIYFHSVSAPVERRKEKSD